MTNKYVYRPRTSWIYFSILAAIELSVIIGFAVAGKTQETIVSLINSAAADILCYVFVVKPKLVLSDEQIDIVNPFQKIIIGWHRAIDFDTRFTFKVETNEGTFSAWAATAPGRYSTRRIHESDFKGTGLESRKVISPSAAPGADSGVALILSLKRKSEALNAGSALGHLTKSYDWLALAFTIASTAVLLYNLMH